MIYIPPVKINGTSLSSTNAGGADPTYGAATSYALGARAFVPALATSYECIQAPALGKYPPSSPLYWKTASTSNPWLMFDTSVGTATTREGGLAWTLAPGQRATAVGLLGLMGGSISLTVRDGPGGAVMFADTQTLKTSDGTYFGWFFELQAQRGEAIWYGLPSSPAAVYEFVITSSGTAACGMCVLGREQFIGEAKYGASIRTMRRSKDYIDANSNPVSNERGRSRQLDCLLQTDLGSVNRIRSLLEEGMQEPALWVIAPGLHDYDTALIFGRFEDLTHAYDGPTHAVGTLTVSGYR